MAEINKYPSSLGSLIETENQTKWSLDNGDGTVSEIDLNKANPQALKNFRLGLAVGEVLYKLNSGILVQSNGPVAQASQNPSDYYNDGNQSMNSSKQNEAGKTLTLNNGHSILGSDNYPSNMGGFTDRILIALLSGVGLGVVATAIYIFIKLGKVTIFLG